MSIYIWRGTSDTNWANPLNWVNLSGVQYTTSYPGQNSGQFDDVYLDDSLGTAAVSPSGYDMTSDYVLNSLRISKDYNGNFGTSDTYFKLKATDVLLDAEKAGNIYIDCIASVASLIVTNGSFINIKGTITSAEFYGGSVTLNSGIVINNTFQTGYKTSLTGDLTLTIPSTATIPSTVNANGGTITCNKEVSTLNINGAEWTQAATSNSTIINVNQGTLIWNTGNISTINAKSGAVISTASQSERKVSALNVYPTCSVDFDAGLPVVHITSYVKYVDGGTVTFANNTYMTEYRPTSALSIQVSPQSFAPSASATGAAGVWVNKFDKVTLDYQIGASNNSIVIEIWEGTDTTHASEQLHSTFNVTAATQNTASRTHTLLGTDLSSGYNSLRLKIYIGGEGTATIFGAFLQVERSN